MKIERDWNRQRKKMSKAIRDHSTIRNKNIDKKKERKANIESIIKDIINNTPT